jgi:hypothetical protein
MQENTMTTQRSTHALSRRTALASIGAGGLALAAISRSTSASQDSALADHPLMGMWLAMANPPLPEDPQFPVPSFYGADGTVVLCFPITQMGPNGVQVSSTAMGTWEPYDERTGHFTAIQVMSDLDGTLTGTVTIDGFPMVSEDGQSFTDDGSLVTITIRDPAGAVVDSFPGAGARPVTALRMAPGVPGFPDTSATPEASPTS